MLRPLMEAAWARPNVTYAGKLAGWKEYSGDLIPHPGRTPVFKLTRKFRPLYLNKRYGLPKKPRRPRAIKPRRSPHGLF